MKNFNVLTIFLDLRNGEKFKLTRKIPAFWSFWRTDYEFVKFCEKFAEKRGSSIYDADLIVRGKNGQKVKLSGEKYTGKWTEWF